jgi:hypothetical protein
LIGGLDLKFKAIMEVAHEAVNAAIDAAESDIRA